MAVVLDKKKNNHSFPFVRRIPPKPTGSQRKDRSSQSFEAIERGPPPLSRSASSIAYKAIGELKDERESARTGSER